MASKVDGWRSVFMSRVPGGVADKRWLRDGRPIPVNINVVFTCQQPHVGHMMSLPDV